nr:STAS domain-containing protein [Actinomadura kijaniata]
MEVVRQDRWLVVCLAGELNHATVEVMDQRLGQAVAGVRGTSVALELSQLTFTGTTGLGIMVAWWRRLTEAGGRLVLVAPTARVRSVLALTGADQFIAVHATVEDAIHNASPDASPDASPGSPSGVPAIRPRAD